MRHPVKIKIEVVEAWAESVECKTEKQKKFVADTINACKLMREKEDLNIVLDIENSFVYDRYKDGEELIPTGEEIQLFYAQSVAKGYMSFNDFA